MNSPGSNIAIFLAVVDAIRSGPHTAQQIAEESEYPVRSIRQVMQRLSGHGYIEFDHLEPSQRRGIRPSAYRWAA